jgi:hypothetical protein
VTASGIAVMAVLTVLAAISLYSLDETFGKDLDYIEK